MIQAAKSGPCQLLWPGAAPLPAFGNSSLFSFHYQRWVRNFFLFRKSQISKYLGSFRNHKSANLWGVPARKSQIRKFFMMNPQISNRKLANFLGVPVCKSQIRKLARKKNSVSDPDPNWFASNIFFNYFVYLRRICKSQSRKSANPQIAKLYSPQIKNLQSGTFAT